MRIAVTGHRPDKLFASQPYSDANFRLLVDFAATEIFEYSDATILSGLALGWDQAVAMACFLNRRPFVACIPCDGQDRLWPRLAQVRYRLLLDASAEVVNVNHGPYAAWKMLARDCYMVNHSERLHALYNGDASGGTAATVKHAQVKQREITNCWDRWLAYRQSSGKGT